VACFALLVSGCGAAEEDYPPLEASPPPVEAAAEVPRLPTLPALGPPVADLSPFERALGERMRAVGETTVLVEMWSGDEVVGHGSGVLVSADGDVLTAAHVVTHRAQHFRVVLPDGTSRGAEVARRDDVHDAALLHAPGAATAFARVRAGAPQSGEWVVCAGHGAMVPGDRVPMRSTGVVVERAYAWTVVDYEEHTRYPKVRKTTTFPGMLRLDCATAPGMSGGPVVDLDGELIGVVVGSPGTAASLEAIRHLLPASARSGDVTAHAMPATPTPTAEASGPPSRAGAITPLFAAIDAERSLIEIEVPSGAGRSEHFTAVLVSADGLVVVPAGRLVETTTGGEPVVAADITVVGHEEAQCTEIVAVRGELALLRITGLVKAAPAGGAESDDGLRPVGPAGVAVVGEMISTVGTLVTDRTVGFVTATDRHPGSVAPDGPRWGCGTHRSMWMHAHPAVTVTAALAHDAAGWPRFGGVIVDRGGRPVAIEVAQRAPGLGFAIPWSDVVSRFDPWL
jgi:S1-C subfamily serine protease